MSYKFKVLEDKPILFLELGETSGTSALDISESSNNGTYSSSSHPARLPLTPGSNNASLINTVQSVSLSIDGMATSNFSDNDFTIESWIYPNFSTSNETVIVADEENSVGLFYKNGNIIFKIGLEEISWTLPYLKKAIYIVATYSPDSISLYIDSNLVSYKQLDFYTFTNEELNLSIGPTLNVGDSFLINSLSLYRYALSYLDIQEHKMHAQTIFPIQVVSPDAGEIFDFYDNNISTKFSYFYPANKSWSFLLKDGLSYNKLFNYIEISKGEGDPLSVVLEDFISIPSELTLDDSRIEWDGDNGISVETSTDGITYVQCLNGKSIPQYSLEDFDESRNLYFKITLSTEDDSQYLPKLYNFSVSFYNNQIMYSQNSGSYISRLDAASTATNYQINLSGERSGILYRDKRNGISVPDGSGFYINTGSKVKTIEFFYTPSSLEASGLIFTERVGETYDGGLPSTTVFSETFNGGEPSSIQSVFISGTTLSNGYYGCQYAWDNSGQITKENISSIYVNGVDHSLETDIFNIFIEGEIHHVVIVFQEYISNQIQVNVSDNGSTEALYQNLAIYEKELNEDNILDHLNLYLGLSSILISDSSFTITENSINSYNIDWLVIQNS